MRSCLGRHLYFRLAGQGVGVRPTAIQLGIGRSTVQGWRRRWTENPEATMREIVGDRTVDEIITVGRQQIEETVLLRLSELSTRYQLGVTINQVQLKNVNPPEPVQPSFNEVNRAQQDRENAINLANGEYNKAVPRARGLADQRIREAEGYRFKRVNEAEGDVAAFNLVLDQYLKAPDVTRTRIYLETLAAVLPQAKQQVIVDEGVQQVLPLMFSPSAALEAK